MKNGIWYDYANRSAAELIAISSNLISNYIVPGLESRIVRKCDTGDLLRIFVATREQHQNVIPHSHRYDLTCKVMRGNVKNRIWRKVDSSDADTFTTMQMDYGGEPGIYQKPREISVDRWGYSTDIHRETNNCNYYLHKSQVHSIVFDKGAVVLIMESDRSDTRSESSIYLEPNIDGKTIHTFATAPWMFLK